MADPAFSDSLTLVLNAAEGRLQFALGRGPELLCAQDWQAQGQGAELLAPALEAALKLCGLKAAQLEHIACVRGPGAFTGLRLALATAAGLARGSGAKQAGLDYLPLLAAEACERLWPTGTDTRFWVLTHARRNLVHLQGFYQDQRSAAPGRVPPICPDTDLLVLAPDAAVKLMAGRARESGPCLLLGSGLARNAQAFDVLLAQQMPQAKIPPLSFNHPSPEFLFRAALELDYAEQDVTPLYARPCDAEENLPEISARLGLDQDAAQRRLAELLK